MHARSILALLLCFVFGACTHIYAPDEYPLTDERIPRIRAAAPVTVVNVQQRSSEELLFAMGAHKYVGDHKEITEHFAAQLRRSLERAGVRVARNGAPKRLDVSVVSITASPGFYHFKAKAVLSVTTGNNRHFEFVANNSSGGNIYRALNGVIAIAVLESMKHPGIRAYLAGPG
jgi:hypothetical protein